MRRFRVTLDKLKLDWHLDSKADDELGGNEISAVIISRKDLYVA